MGKIERIASEDVRLITMNTNKNRWELKRDGSIERVGPFGSYGPVVHAQTKADARAKLLAFAYRALAHGPTIKSRNGAWQISYVAMDGLNVEAGLEGREHPLCLSHVQSKSELTDQTASFDYYASDAYRSQAA